MIVSASERQALIVLDYVAEHMEKLGIVPSITHVGGSVTICGIPSWFGGKLLRNIRVSGNNLNCIN